MKDIIKGLWKWILAILIILLLGGIILAFRIFVIDKNFDGKSESARRKNNSTSENSSGLLQAIGNSTVKGYKEDDYDYNVHNFDEAFLMYEGEQTSGAVKDILEHLISNSEGKFYARTSVTSVNFGNNVTIDYSGNVDEYQEKIREMENSVTDGMYEISFRYGALGSYVNEIVITKK